MQYDFSSLGEGLFQFIMVADTHDTPGLVEGAGEFPSRGKQRERVAALLDMMEGLEADFLLHLGDLVQEYPESAGFAESLGKALARFRALPMDVFHVAGNHDIGDKPDPTMPTSPVNGDKLAAYHSACGRSWYRMERADCRLLIVNTQILETGLPEEREQRDWLEAELAGAGDRRLLLFLHLPLYLGREDEPALGNYDVVGLESRKWLLGLIRRYRIALVCGAHVHFSFYEEIESCAYHQLASPCFTRPGFSHLFSSPAPPERGRDDTGKLGFYLVRVLSDDIRLHFIRTHGSLGAGEVIPDGASLLLAPAVGGGRGSPLGVTLREPILREGEVPIAFPSVVRQRVRNDYPFFNLREAGAAHLRVPLGDWNDGLQRRRLRQLAKDGVSLTVFALERAPFKVPERRAKEEVPDVIEWQLPGILFPDREAFAGMRADCVREGVGLSLAPVIPGTVEAGKQHSRTRVGYLPGELPRLARSLEEEKATLERAVLAVSPSNLDPIWNLRAVGLGPTLLERPGFPALDLVLSLDSEDDVRNCAALAEVFLLSLAIRGSRLFVDPLTDLDRTMDAVHGLCDTLHNPRSAFVLYRTLNAVFFPERESGSATDSFAVTREQEGLFRISMDKRRFGLLLKGALPSDWCVDTVWELERGLVYRMASDVPREHFSSRLRSAFPRLFTFSEG